MHSQFLIPIDDPRIFQSDLCGQKATTLAKLADLVTVPYSIVLSNNAFTEFLECNELGEEFVKTKGDFTELKLPNSIKEAVQDLCSLFCDQILAVRSSSLLEDTSSQSAAGVFQSQIGIPAQPSALSMAIKRVWGSLFSDRALNYEQRLIHAGKFSMPVLVQPVIKASSSGVAFSIHPVKGKGSLIEAVPGLAIPLVNGRLVPDRFFWSEESNQYEQEIVRKIIAYIPAPNWYHYKAGDKVYWNRDKELIECAFLKYVSVGIAAIRIVDRKFSSGPILSEAEVEELASTCKQIAKALDSEVDVEWALEQGQLVILQARPMTTTIQVEESVRQDSEISARMIFHGIGLAKGIGRGYASILSSGVNEDSILVSQDLRPENLPEILKSKAVITGRGGVLSHVAILCRELDKPCVQIDDYWKVEAGTEIIVDGHQGLVYILD